MAVLVAMMPMALPRAELLLSAIGLDMCFQPMLLPLAWFA